MNYSTLVMNSLKSSPVVEQFCVVIVGFTGAYRYAPTDYVTASRQLAGMPLCIDADLYQFCGWVKTLQEVTPVEGSLACEPRPGRRWTLMASVPCFKG